ncbi:MAG: hypothetical protein V7760_00770 [Marinobacter sp.]
MRNKKEPVRFACWFRKKTIVLQEGIYGKPDLGLADGSVDELGRGIEVSAK